jgi:two-component system response regulator NreC
MASAAASPRVEGTVTIVLADDHHVARSGLRLLLLEVEDGFAVVAEADAADAADRSVLGHKPDVLVLDLNMPGDLTSLDAIPLVGQRWPHTAIVVLTMQAEPAFARRALQAGAIGYVLKDSANAELVAVRRAAAGETYLAPRLGAALAAMPATLSGPPDDLTPRELEMLRLIALGHTNAEIGKQPHHSVRAVESHRAHIQQKLRRSTRAELVGYALDHNLLQD